jgi:UDP-N-acetylglucosamine transferase subunit ALG13
VILVTLGTHPQPMDRLVDAVEDLIRRQVIAEPVIFQAAVFSRKPDLARTAGIEPFEVLDGWIREARIVICHGGPGTILQVLAAGKVPRVVPRDPSLGEHVDDHQVRFVRWLAERMPIVPIWDLATLATALDDRAGSEAPPSAAQRSGTAAKRLIELVESSR